MSNTLGSQVNVECMVDMNILLASFLIRSLFILFIFTSGFKAKEQKLNC